MFSETASVKINRSKMQWFSFLNAVCKFMTRYTIKQYEINTIINCFNYHSEMYIRFAQIVCKKKTLHRYDKAQ